MPNELSWWLPTRSKFENDWERVKEYMIANDIIIPDYQKI
jgi:hypothetical protein